MSFGIIWKCKVRHHKELIFQHLNISIIFSENLLLQILNRFHRYVAFLLKQSDLIFKVVFLWMKCLKKWLKEIIKQRWWIGKHNKWKKISKNTIQLFMIKIFTLERIKTRNESTREMKLATQKTASSFWKLQLETCCLSLKSFITSHFILQQFVRSQNNRIDHFLQFCFFILFWIRKTSLKKKMNLFINCQFNYIWNDDFENKISFDWTSNIIGKKKYKSN